MQSNLLSSAEVGRPEATRRVTRGARVYLRARGFAVMAEMPLPNAHGAMLAREAPSLRLAPASRKAMLVRFGALAAERYCALAFGDERLES